MSDDELQAWLQIFKNAYKQAETFPKDSQGAITAQILFACLTGAVHKAMVEKDFDK